jgi:hypothetical protein
MSYWFWGAQVSLAEAKLRWAAAAQDETLRGSPAWEMQHGKRDEVPQRTEEPTNEQLDPIGLLGLYP